MLLAERDVEANQFPIKIFHLPRMTTKIKSEIRKNSQEFQKKIVIGADQSSAYKNDTNAIFKNASKFEIDIKINDFNLKFMYHIYMYHIYFVDL